MEGGGKHPPSALPEENKPSAFRFKGESPGESCCLLSSFQQHRNKIDFTSHSPGSVTWI